MSDERETIQRNPESVAAWKCECAFLHEQVEKLTDECVVLRASSRSKLETISSLELQVEKLTKERDALVDAIDNEMVVTHMGVFNLGDDPKVALNKICCYEQDLGKFFAEEACKEQLAALAEQNAKFRETLSRWRYQNLSYNWCCGNCGAVDGDEHKEGCALSLPDLASPVLNRIRAEAMEEAAKIANEHEGVAWAVSAIRNRKAELEKSNG